MGPLHAVASLAKGAAPIENDIHPNVKEAKEASHDMHEDALATENTKDTKLVYPAVPLEVEHIATDVIGAAITVHRTLGPGFLERIYQEALCLELDARQIRFERERAVVVRYRGVAIPGQRIDLIVGDCVLVELKAAAAIDRAHVARVISYLRTTGLRLALILNFNAPTLRDGLKRIVL